MVARGWESKGIESQKLDAESPHERSDTKALTPEARAVLTRRNMLILSRTRVTEELERCSNDRFRAQLRGELKFLEHEIKKLEI